MYIYLDILLNGYLIVKDLTFLPVRNWIFDVFKQRFSKLFWFSNCTLCCFQAKSQETICHISSRAYNECTYAAAVLQLTVINPFTIIAHFCLISIKFYVSSMVLCLASRVDLVGVSKVVNLQLTQLAEHFAEKKLKHFFSPITTT